MKRYNLLLLVCCLSVCTNLRAQGLPHVSSHADSDRSLVTASVSSDSNAVFALVRKVENGILLARLEDISGDFSHEVYINMQGSEAGYYSANQASYILLNFFGARTTVGFKLSTVGYTDDAPYATGAGVFTRPGKRETLQIYLGLTKVERRWVISQFNVY